MADEQKPTAKVLEFPGGTTLPIDPDKILQQAIGQYREVVLIGVPKDDDAITVATSEGYLPDVLWLLERAKLSVHEQADRDD